jgi:hypothetical protein
MTIGNATGVLFSSAVFFHSKADEGKHTREGEEELLD